MLPIQVCSYLWATCTAVIGLLRCSSDLLNAHFILPGQGGWFFFVCVCARDFHQISTCTCLVVFDIPPQQFLLR